MLSSRTSFTGQYNKAGVQEKGTGVLQMSPVQENELSTEPCVLFMWLVTGVYPWFDLLRVCVLAWHIFMCIVQSWVCTS